MCVHAHIWQDSILSSIGAEKCDIEGLVFRNFVLDTGNFALLIKGHENGCFEEYCVSDVSISDTRRLSILGAFIFMFRRSYCAMCICMNKDPFGVKPYNGVMLPTEARSAIEV